MPAVSFKLPSSRAAKMLCIDRFKGIDLYSAPANISPDRSPSAPNMIRGEVGKVRKRMGYATQKTYPERINGVHFLGGIRLVHAGSCLYWETISGGIVYTHDYMPLADNRSKSFVFDNKLYILDGTYYLVFDGYSVRQVCENAYAPTIVISRAPTGGGTPFEPVNLISRFWEEDFLGTASATVYQMTTENLDGDEVTAYTLNNNGTWKALTEGVDFTVNRTTGQVTFVTAPGVSPVTGEDNVRIVATKTRDGYFERINSCTVFAAYGVNGTPDRVFLGGGVTNNVDHYSAMGNPSYFGDSWYALLGQGDSKVVGYSVISNCLAAHKSGGSDGRSIIVRTGQLLEYGDGSTAAAFPVVNTLIGEPAVSPYAFAYLGQEPLFLTANGVCAITSEELSGERCTQQRSMFISAALQAASGKDAAFAVIYRDFYVLALDGDLYLLDGLQKAYSQNAPYSSFQYEAYCFPQIGARLLWTEGDYLWFGTADGRLCRFFSDPDDPASYYDDGLPIDAGWETPDICGSLFSLKKNFRRISISLAPSGQTGAEVSVLQNGVFRPLFTVKDRSSASSSSTFSKRIRLNNTDKARFRIGNAQGGEPFGLNSLSLEYTEGESIRL